MVPRSAARVRAVPEWVRSPAHRMKMREEMRDQELRFSMFSCASCERVSLPRVSCGLWAPPGVGSNDRDHLRISRMGRRLRGDDDDPMAREGNTNEAGVVGDAFDE